MGSAMELLLRLLFQVGSVVVVALPGRYRRTWPIRDDGDLRGPAIASGFFEFLIGVPGAMFYIPFALRMGIAGLVLNPYLPLAFLFVEGIVRALAALGPGQILPIFPLQVVAWIHDSVDRKINDQELGPVVIDVVERGDGRAYDLCVLSCRAKPHWNSYMTIRYEGEFYQMFQQEWMTGSQKFAYFLRKNPEWRHVVVVYEYRPDEVLNPPATLARWKPQPQRDADPTST